MALAWALNVSSEDLDTGYINGALDNYDVSEIAQYIRSSENFKVFYLSKPPVNEGLGRQISGAIVNNSHIIQLIFFNERAAIRNLVAWIASLDTLVNMTNLQWVAIRLHHDMSLLDCSALFPLLLTSTSLHIFEIYFPEGNNRCIDDVMSALSRYVGAASLTEFEFHSGSISEAAFTALCDGIALSTVRKFTVCQLIFKEINLETHAESIARMIMESSLEEVFIRENIMAEPLVPTWSERFISSLKLTAPVRNLDFAFTQIEHDKAHLRINRKWKPLVSANTPLAMWPHILKKSHASPETSHGSTGILFYLLRQRPDLVPAP